MGDNQPDGGPKPGPREEKKYQPIEKVPAPINWGAVLGFGIAAYGVITGSYDHWREWWVISAWPVALILAGLGLRQWLQKHTDWNDDNIFCASIMLPLLMGTVIGMAYIASWPAKKLPTLVWEMTAYEALPPGIAYEPGQRVGGITWVKGRIPLKLVFKIGEREVRNMDFKITLDRGKTIIWDMGQINPFSEMTAIPTMDLGWGSNNIAVVGTMIVSGKTTNGTKVSAVLEPEKGKTISPVWRIRFNRLSPNSEEIILVAAGRLGNSSLPEGRILWVNISGTCDVTSLGTNATGSFNLESRVRNAE